jgi:methionyl-tRNA formyltransferase
LKIIFFGSSKFVVPTIKALSKNFDLELVVTTEKSGGDVPSFCIKNKIPYISASSLSDINPKSLILNHKSNVAVVTDFGLIIPKEILNSFPMGIINIHPSLLPKYRGPSPVQTAILNGETTTGVSIIKIDEEVDHGPILGQVKEAILDADTAETLYKRLFEKGTYLLLKVLKPYIDGNLKPSAQDHSKAIFSNSLTRQDGYVEIAKIKDQKSKLGLERKIRAYFPWPGVWFKTKLNGMEKIIKLLPHQRLQVEGKKPMPYKDFLNGYPQAKELLKAIC